MPMHRRCWHRPGIKQSIRAGDRMEPRHRGASRYGWSLVLTGKVDDRDVHGVGNVDQRAQLLVEACGAERKHGKARHTREKERLGDRLLGAAD